jgi:hypothetical protein
MLQKNIFVVGWCAAWREGLEGANKSREQERRRK